MTSKPKDWRKGETKLKLQKVLNPDPVPAPEEKPVRSKWDLNKDLKVAVDPPKNAYFAKNKMPHESPVKNSSPRKDDVRENLKNQAAAQYDLLFAHQQIQMAENLYQGKSAYGNKFSKKSLSVDPKPNNKFGLTDTLVLPL